MLPFFKYLLDCLGFSELTEIKKKPSTVSEVMPIVPDRGTITLRFNTETEKFSPNTVPKDWVKVENIRGIDSPYFGVDEYDDFLDKASRLGYDVSVVDYTPAVDKRTPQQEPESKKEEIVYKTAKEFSDACNLLTIRKDGFIPNISIMSVGTSGYDPSRGGHYDLGREETAATCYMFTEVPYLGQCAAGKIEWSKNYDGVEVEYFRPKDKIESSAYGCTAHERLGNVSALEAYEFVKSHMVDPKSVGNLVTEKFGAVSVGKNNELKWIQDVDPSRINDPKYIKKSFTAKRAQDLESGKIIIVQYQGLGRSCYRFDDRIHPLKPGTF